MSWPSEGFSARRRGVLPLKLLNRIVRAVADLAQPGIPPSHAEDYNADVKFQGTSRIGKIPR